MSRKWIVMVAVEADDVPTAVARAEDMLEGDYGGSDFNVISLPEEYKTGDRLPWVSLGDYSVPAICRPDDPSLYGTKK